MQLFTINLNCTAQSCNRCCRRLVKLRIRKTYLLEYIFRKERYSILSETDFKTFCYKSKNKRSRALKLKLSKLYLSTKLKHLLLSWKIHTTLITFITFKQCLRILVSLFFFSLIKFFFFVLHLYNYVYIPRYNTPVHRRIQIHSCLLLLGLQLNFVGNPRYLG